MDDRKRRREIEKVVRRVMKSVEQYDQIGKAEFEAVLQKVMQQVQKNTGIDADRIARTTETVLEDLPHEYGRMDDDARSWETLIAYLYGKYLKELGVP